MYEKYLKVRGIFYGVVFASVVGMLVMSFMVRKVFVSEVMLVPSVEEASQLQSQSAMFFQLSRGLMATPVQIFIDIASSYSFKREFVETYHLDTIFQTDNPDKQVKLLDSKVELEVLPSASILLRVYDSDRERAKRLAQLYVEFLNRKANYALNIKGRELRRFLENRLKSLREEIAALQDSLKTLESKNRFLTVATEEILGPSLGKLLETLAMKESEYMLLRSFYSEDVPEVSRLKREVGVLRREVDRKFSTLPPAVQKAARYKMELEIKSKAYATLYEEYEKARLMELKNNPMLQPVSSPSGPQKRVWPKRVIPAITMVIGLTFALALMLTVFVAADHLRDTTLGRIITSIRGDLLP
ncbi:MAG: hypothetical protein GXO29_01025 [Thermotogae bacterium]|nr:hypothetical protein [Thermotogota bacterium]